MTTILRYAKLGEEATFREDPTPATDVTFDIASSSLDAPSDSEIVFEGGLSRGVHRHVPGFYTPSGNLITLVDVHSIGWLLKWALGGYVFTADTPSLGTNTHELFVQEGLLVPTFNTRIGKDVFEHEFRGCAAGSLSLETSDGLVQATVDIMAAEDRSSAAGLDTRDNILAVLTSPKRMTFADLSLTVAGGDESAKIQSLTWNYANNVDAGAGRGFGSRHPQRMPAAARDVTFDMTVWYDGTAHLERVWGAAGGVVPGGSTEQALVITMDGGADGSLELNMPRTVFNAVQQQPSGRSRIEQSIIGRAYLESVARADLTNVRTEVLATLENAVAQMTS